ncbi:ribose-5-phosphate isomerase RpiA [Chryseolinea lacunae]|uniref:Ribose-5-phosphate isomerase A n=1 Tax=Chryseolinea lacunae TaxID=2801331 RepID=A0ABS1L0U9_9BACT|nr:ribose-5-phosphate isomerase RpiA [Chryseolinea lacunae]MBL0745336.1 ribose-5-phosphate isomerase RpiA [Chryseolinea lacunae]
MEAKRYAGEWSVRYIEPGMTIGLGTGSTVFFAIQKIGELAKQGLTVKAVASSDRSEKLARELNIPIVSFSSIDSIDVTIDGADEVDAQCNLIKGGGGAHTREKILAYNSKDFIVIADSSKLVEKLGKFPLPVEIVPFATSLTLQHLKATGCEPHIRQENGQDYITENGNLTVDCQFKEILHPILLDAELRKIPGVVATGLFSYSMVTKVIVGYSSGLVKEINPHEKT